MERESWGDERVLRNEEKERGKLWTNKGKDGEQPSGRCFVVTHPDNRPVWLPQTNHRRVAE